MNDVRAKKYLGQHFLRDETIAENIVKALPANTTKVLEIGPGMGVLTKYLRQNSDISLKVVEIDTESVAYLHEKYPELTVISEDFLKMNLDTLFDGEFAVIGNFPYNISSQILFKVLDHRNAVPCVVGMFQKEVAERIAAKSGNKIYGILSVLLQAFYDIEYLFTVHEHVFSPPPKVKSAVIRLTRNSRQHLNCDEKQFFATVKTAFNQRRKTLRNALSAMFDKSLLTDPIFDKRAEQLTVEDFEQICLSLTSPTK
ncbi:MAG: 16S rRNA (adenine(1518)-N(6)/adenine(1519)-N(6))-dimethyltransferase RsmA [Bacteroidales bacterium]|jgi:16S rRNA (adenine1518-N6/adenine1519-N6)-dimethyltransferase|nr:16S rRNA (adenine(1518)-N(6)/adenine(1519)-N(6))-dimethyltransferase RsmA [Bacteroidales bacterium]